MYSKSCRLNSVCRKSSQTCDGNSAPSPREFDSRDRCSNPLVRYLAAQFYGLQWTTPERFTNDRIWQTNSDLEISMTFNSIQYPSVMQCTVLSRSKWHRPFLRTVMNAPFSTPEWLSIGNRSTSNSKLITVIVQNAGLRAYRHLNNVNCGAISSGCEAFEIFFCQYAKGSATQTV